MLTVASHLFPAALGSDTVYTNGKGDAICTGLTYAKHAHASPGRRA